MSYDIQVWSVNNPEFGNSAPNLDGWKKRDDSWFFEKRDWQIVISPPDVVLAEDIPAEVSMVLPGVQFCLQLTLQPINAPVGAREKLHKTATSLAKTRHGVVLDCQTNDLTTPRGVKRFLPRSRPERFAVLKLGWWFLDDRIFSREGLAGLLDIFESLLPEALPRRYGHYEPPQFLLADHDRDHLLTFLHEHLDDSPVLYPTRPILGLSFSCTKTKQDPRSGFKSNYLSIECEAYVIDQPGWQGGLQRVWFAVSSYLNVFYSEVRTLKGFLRMGPTYGCDQETDDGPIRSWFWRGIPAELGHAMVIGSPYTELWPEAASRGKLHDDLIVLDSGKWIEANNLTIKPPESIRQVHSPRHEGGYNDIPQLWIDTYPEIWPFDDQISSSR